MHKILFIILTTLLLSCNTKSDNNSQKHWAYKIDYDFEKRNDSVKSIGLIQFLRTKSIKDKKREEIYNEDWIPAIQYEIFNISDFEFCEQASLRTKRLASCLPPNVGGDLIVVQNYIFLNRSVCLNCIGTENKVDYCRPIVNKVLSDLDLTKTNNLMEIDKEIGMKIKRIE
ncbi:hypothetical protein [Thalassobellus citreus]|uniref:hypothetical protein n=1 Tax=Thalassobellus citreus TaxID=3367752 RepID=UPI0037A9A6FA